MNKPKLLAWCDFLVPTGFGNVAKELLDTMHEDYETLIVGINYYGQTRYDTRKYFVYPVNKDDIIGFNTLINTAKNEKPDIIFLFQDIFHLHEIIPKLKEVSPKSKIVSYFPVDGQPFAKVWENVIKDSDCVITYSDWAIQVIKDALPDITKPIYKLYHGVNFNIFKPLPMREIIDQRVKIGWGGKFVVTNVNRFQPRKNISGTLRSFSMFAKGYKVCKCGNHMPLFNKRCDLNMCPPEDIIEVYDRQKKDVFLYLHMQAQEYSMGPGKTNLLQQHALNAGFSTDDVGKIIGLNARQIYGGDVTPEDVNVIYNISNINISSTTGEGCGLSLLESQATGTSSIAPNNSAIPEQLNGTGRLIRSQALYAQALDNGHLRPIVDPWEMSKALEEEYLAWKKAKVEKFIKRDCIENVLTNFQWKDKVEFLKERFREVLV